MEAKVINIVLYSNIFVLVAFLVGYFRMKKSAALSKKQNADLSKKIQEIETKKDELGTLVENITSQNEQLVEKIKILEEENYQLVEKHEKAYNELQETEMQLIQKEKMASLGQLSAGIAHEINTPMGAISCNVDISKRIILMMKEHVEQTGDEKLQELLFKLAEINQIDIMACERMGKMVKSLKHFARLDDQDWYQDINIHEEIDNSLVLLNNRIKKGFEIIKDYGELPRVRCYASQLNQVFMNLLVNAMDALDEEKEVAVIDDNVIEEKKIIWIKTCTEGDDKVKISIKDNGVGINQANLEKIFVPGFTTKGVGVGTGLGLAITFDIIQKHKGKLDVKSEPGIGTEFIIELPVK